jgi:hypothetical protein
MGPELAIARIVLVPAFLIIGGFGAAFLTAPQSIKDPFEFHAPGGMSYLNVSDTFYGTGTIQMEWYSFEEGNASIGVYECHSPSCGPSDRSLVYVDSAPLHWAPDVMASGYGPGEYVIVGSNLTWPAFGNVTFEFSPSIYPWAVAVTEFELAGGLVGLAGIGFAVWTATRR